MPFQANLFDGFDDLKLFKTKSILTFKYYILNDYQNNFR